LWLVLQHPSKSYCGCCEREDWATTANPVSIFGLPGYKPQQLPTCFILRTHIEQVANQLIFIHRANMCANFMKDFEATSALPNNKQIEGLLEFGNFPNN
jgi:hypothetical protein